MLYQGAVEAAWEAVPVDYVEELLEINAEAMRGRITM